MGWSQSYKQGSEEGRGEWARAGRQRPRWRGREGLESGVLGPERPLLLFQKASACAFSSLPSRCVSLSRCPLIPAGLFWGLACPFRQDKTLSLGSRVPQGSPPKLRIRRPGPQGQRTHLPSTSIPYLTSLSLHHLPLSVCLGLQVHVQADTALRGKKEEGPPEPYVRWDGEQSGYFCHRAGLRGSCVKRMEALSRGTCDRACLAPVSGPEC